MVALTAGAERHAGKHALALALSGLGRDCAVGDLVSVEQNGTRHDFSIIRRRWIAGDDNTALELTLDYPARPGGR